MTQPGPPWLERRYKLTCAKVRDVAMRASGHAQLRMADRKITLQEIEEAATDPSRMTYPSAELPDERLVILGETRTGRRLKLLRGTITTSSSPSPTVTVKGSLEKMMVQYDTEAGATYARLTDDAVAGTVNISDLVMVDVDATGQPVGIDFAVLPSKISDAMLYAVADRFPPLKELALNKDWLLQSC